MLSKSFIFFKFIISTFFLMFQEVTWRAWKNFLHFRKINLLPSSLKTPVFLENPFLFLSLLLWMFSFLYVFISSSYVFIDDCICLLHCFVTVVLVTTSATDLRENFLLSGVLYLTLLPAFIKVSLESLDFRLPRIQNIDPSVNLTHLFVWITQSSVITI